MFLLRVHSVDTNHLLTLDETTTSSATSTTSTTKFVETRGISYLYRNTSQKSSLPNPNPNSRSICLFVVAVPNYFSSSDFIRFCGSHIDHVNEVLFIRYCTSSDNFITNSNCIIKTPNFLQGAKLKILLLKALI